MKQILLSMLFIAFSLTALTQKSERIELILNEDGMIKLETIYQQTSLEQVQNWLASLSHNVRGKIEFSNPKTGEIRYKGFTLICLSEKPSVFQTKMFFTIAVHKEAKQYFVEIKDIFYQSIPEYGKQGTPAIITYPEDWYSKTKLYRKSGKTRWLHQMVKQNTISKAKELLASGDEFFQ